MELNRCVGESHDGPTKHRQLLMVGVGLGWAGAMWYESVGTSTPRVYVLAYRTSQHTAHDKEWRPLLHRLNTLVHALLPPQYDRVMAVDSDEYLCVPRCSPSETQTTVEGPHGRGIWLKTHSSSTPNGQHHCGRNTISFTSTQPRDELIGCSHGGSEAGGLRAPRPHSQRPASCSTSSTVSRSEPSRCTTTCCGACSRGSTLATASATSSAPTNWSARSRTGAFNACPQSSRL
jgi:hypothetical protein